MDKKSIVLLIISGVILIVAIVFAIWSFRVDVSTAEQQLATNTKQSTNTIVRQNTVNEVTQDESKTQDFDATYADFTVEDEEGKTIKLSDYQNQPVMILFWNDENKDSVEMLNRMNEQYDTYKGTIQFIAIYTGEKSNANLQNIKLPIYYDKNQEVMNMYNVIEVPTMLYINKENEVFNSKTGLSSKDALKANLDILAENF